MAKFDHKSGVEQEYDKRADAYLKSKVHFAGADLDFITERVGVQPDAIALDLGCGGGHVSFRLAPNVFRVIAYDLAQNMLATVSAEATRRGITNIVTKQGAVETLPCASDTFDIAVTRYSAHHWQDMAVGVRQIHRVLKASGLAIFSDVLTPGLALQDTWLQTVELLRDSSHVRNAKLSEWVSILESVGFAIEQIVMGRLRLDFKTWIARTHTQQTNIAAIQSLQLSANCEVRDYFEIDAEGSFTVDEAVLVARKRAAPNTVAGT